MENAKRKNRDNAKKQENGECKKVTMQKENAKRCHPEKGDNERSTICHMTKF